MNRDSSLEVRQGNRSELIERERDLAGLLALAREGGEAIALVFGEAGIGKSSLVGQFAQSIAVERTVMVGRSDPLSSSRPFGPLYDISEDLGELLQTLEGKGKSRNEIFHAVASQLARLDRSAVLIFEDVHWIDPSTAELLQYIARRITEYGFLVVLTYRSEELGSGHPLLSVLGELPRRRVTRFALRQLSVDGVAALAGCSRQKAQTIHDLTGGVPFYVREFVEAGEELPNSVSDLLSARLDRLPADMRSVVEWLSVSPEPVQVEILQKVAGSDAIELALGCVEAGILKEFDDGRFFLRHELARLAVYDSLSESQRRRAHKAYCEALQGSNRSAMLAIQLHHADAAKDAPSVLDLSYRAALSAARLGAHSEAYDHASVGRKYLQQAADRTAAELQELWAGSACVSTSMDGSVISAREASASLWFELGDVGRAADNLRWKSRLHWYRCEPDQARDTGMRCIELLRSTDDPRSEALAAALHAQLLFLDLEMNEAISMARSAIALDEQVGSPEARVHALNTLGAARCFLGEHEGIEQLRLSIELAESATYDDYASRDADIARGYLNLADYAADDRQFDLADCVITEGCRRCGDIDFELWVMQLTGRRAEVFLEQGRIADAVQLAGQVLAYEAMTPQAAQRPRLVLAKAAMRTGDDSAEQQLEQCLALARTSADTGIEIAVRLSLVEWAFLKADTQKARLHLGHLADIPRGKFHHWHAASFEAWRRYFGHGQKTSTASPWTNAFRLERDGETSAAFQCFVDERLPFEAVLCLMRNPGGELRETFRRAEELCSSLGANALLERLEHSRQGPVARRKRGPYKAARSHPLGLTRKELEVLGVLAEGATNREIAEHFNRSVRTVDRHVSTLLKKLDASSRIDMIIRLGNEPWILEAGPENH